MLTPQMAMIVFQFHKGTIRTSDGGYGNEFIKFQFHKGTIRTGAGIISGAGSLIFQFHKGTIRTI